MVLVAPRSAKLVEARGARFTLLIGYVFCLLGFLTMLLLWNEGISYWKVGLGYALRRDRRRVRRHAGLALAHRLGARDAGRHGLGHRRPPARPRRRDHAVDPRRAAHGGLRDGGRRGDRRPRPNEQQITDSVAEPADEVVRRRGGRSRSSTRSTRARSPPAAKQSFLDGADWAYTAGIVAILPARRSSSSSSRSARTRSSCSPATTPRTRRRARLSTDAAAAQPAGG